jgi:hypothetical protein
MLRISGLKQLQFLVASNFLARQGMIHKNQKAMFVHRSSWQLLATPDRLECADGSNPTHMAAHAHTVHSTSSTNWHWPHLENETRYARRKCRKPWHFMQNKLRYSISGASIELLYGICLDLEREKYCVIFIIKGRSQWRCGLWFELSSPTQTLGSWVRIPLEARMSVCDSVLSVCLTTG